MERIQVFIDKLKEQSSRGDTIAQLMVTVQSLQQELIHLQRNTKQQMQTKVAVTLPSFLYANVEDVKDIRTDKEVFELQINEAELDETELVEEQKPQKSDYALNKVVQPPPIPEQPIVPEVKKQIHHMPFSVEEEAPTLVQHISTVKKEIHESIGDQKESWNDKLKQQKIELAHVLKDAPIKDLRKGIGVNDKFLFINELFRGDEAMYDRSIRTINAFNILPEAEYWINRELKVKLGWNDNKDVVQHFYAVVRRRFS